LQRACERHHHHHRPDTYHDAHPKPFVGPVSNIRLPSQPDCFRKTEMR
jgi:hypothetical protein